MSQLFQSIQQMSPAWQRDLLYEAIPSLVRKYGDIAATAASEWYEQVRASQVSGAYDPITADSYSDEAIQKTVRWQAGKLFDDNTASMAEFLDGAVNRWVQYSGRETIARNIKRDLSNPRFARVPQGHKTCAFCSLLASRGFIYKSEATAGEFTKYHNDCHCQIVPDWDKESSHIEGYDPDLLYSRYEQARESLGPYPKPDEILASMRKMFPNDFTDGAATQAA